MSIYSNKTLRMSRGLQTLSMILCVVVSVSHCKKSNSVSMNLDAKWLDTPLLLEASEVLAEESNEKFWQFVNGIADLDPTTYVDNDQQAFYDLTLTLVKPLLTPLKLDLFKFSLSVRAQSPRVEMFSQIGHSKLSPQKCDAFVDINNLVTCDLESLEVKITDAQGQPKPLLVKSDHHFPGTQHINTTVILYAEVGTQAFVDWHRVLKPKAEAKGINYVLRHYITVPDERKVRLSGYGVELAIKSQEYKAKDDTKVEGQQSGEGDGQAEEEEEDMEIQGFAFKQLKTIHPQLEEDLDKFRQHLLSSNTEMPELKVWQLQDLSFQAAQRVMTSPDEEKLKTLRDLSQNFPVKTRVLTKTAVSDSLRKEIKKNQVTWEQKLGLTAGDSALFINGIQADLDVYDVFTLQETMSSEARLMEGLHALGVQGSDLTDMLKIEVGDSETSYAVDFRDQSVVWVNNLEKDRRYQGWPTSLTELLRPAFPGMLRHIRKNMFNVLFIVDPSNMNHKDLLKMAEAFYVHSAPIRMGVLLVVNPDLDVDGSTDAGVALFRAFNYLSEEERPLKALEFITEVYSQVEEGETMTSDHVMSVLSEKRPHVTRSSILGAGGDKYDKNRKESFEHFSSLGLGDLPQVLVNGVPLKQEELDSENFEEALVSGISGMTPQLQKAVYNGFLYDGMDILEYLMTRTHVMPRLNARVLGAATKVLDLTSTTEDSGLPSAQVLQTMSASEKIGAVAGSIKYLTKKEEPAIRSLTNWVVTDLDSVEGRSIMYEALKQLKSSSTSRLAVVHNPAHISDSHSDHPIARAVQVALDTLPVGMAKSFITKLVKEENVATLVSGEKTMDDLAVNKMDMTSYMKTLKNYDILSVLRSHSVFVQAVNCEPGQRALMSNGKVIGPFKEGEVFTQEDFSLLEKYNLKTVAEKVEKKIKKMKFDENRSSELIMRVSALLQSGGQSDSSRKDTPYTSDKHSVIKLPARDPTIPAYDVTAILDPTSRAAQKYTPILMVLQEMSNVNMKIFLNSKSQLSEMPLKSFYRYVLSPEIQFNPVTHMSVGPAAVFQDLPQKPILTLTLDAPESWLVESVKTTYDLDNIHLEEFESSVHADFELEYLLLEGHCFDATTSQPPRGLQFTLGTEKQPALVDTIVMANLGYFQLKAVPGVWDLKLRHGRSQDIYQIASHERTDSPPDSKDVMVVMDTLKSKIIKLRVAKKPGMQNEDLLSDGANKEESQGIWDTISRLKSTLTGNHGETAPLEDKDGTINIFSLASGHLYERFLRIMILSVLKNTQSKVKFWFLKNYLSPSFKDFIPHMAKEYGFEVELVQYKWPRWLHQQTEKQRVMWGYKILFLDVLFPLNISKIIFVDADQIVRTDLKELVDLDLEGAPYGYTPFCDSRKEMDGFRFWKSGYWNSHLAGRKYHISALYVVDLKKFRKIAAGDRLRGQYQGLSQDPNSLSNLDQDLPNNMIHQVPIKSLPQEWLWCETWCSDSEKQTAKTIDLCNNPLTKEPKLTAAQRIVPEWVDYDNEAKALWDRVYKGKSAKQSAEHSDTVTTDKQKHSEL